MLLEPVKALLKLENKVLFCCVLNYKVALWYKVFVFSINHSASNKYENNFSMVGNYPNVCI